MQRLQPHGLTYPVTLWRDHKGGRVRIDLGSGANSLISAQVRQGGLVGGQQQGKTVTKTTAAP